MGAIFFACECKPAAIVYTDYYTEYKRREEFFCRRLSQKYPLRILFNSINTYYIIIINTRHYRRIKNCIPNSSAAFSRASVHACASNSIPYW